MHDRCCRNFNHTRFIRNDVMACTSAHASAAQPGVLSMDAGLSACSLKSYARRKLKRMAKADWTFDVHDATGQVISDDGN